MFVSHVSLLQSCQEKWIQYLCLLFHLCFMPASWNKWQNIKIIRKYMCAALTKSSYPQACRGCQPAAASVICWMSCLHPPAAALKGHHCPGSSHQGSETRCYSLKHKQIISKYHSQKKKNQVYIQQCEKEEWDAAHLSGLKTDGLQSSKSQVVPVSELSEPTDDTASAERRWI